MKIIEIWPKGYADRDGLSRLTVADDVDPANAATAAFGSFAKIYRIVPAIRVAVPAVSEEYARMMSQHDNS